jgi:hypothetical protein
MEEDEVHEVQRRRRDFIRTHHPDRGGDPDAFVAGLQSFDAGGQSGPDDETGTVGQPDGGPLPPVYIFRRRTWLARLVIAASERLRQSHKPPRVR